jgi:hypothetical protein
MDKMEIIIPSTSLDCWGDKARGIILHRYRAHSDQYTKLLLALIIV